MVRAFDAEESPSFALEAAPNFAAIHMHWHIPDDSVVPSIDMSGGQRTSKSGELPMQGWKCFSHKTLKTRENKICSIVDNDNFELDGARRLKITH
jgi:hypothetical protein